MKLMRILALLLVLCVACSLCACKQDAADPTDGTGATDATEATDATQATQIENAQDGNVTYTVTVVDESGDPLAGMLVQMCLESCYPGMTDENGVATFSLAEADYKVSFLTPPEGYTVEDAYYFDAGSYELTITLTAAE